MVRKILRERYCLEQKLGKNTGRQTFLARDLTNNQLVVIKLLRFGSDFQWSDLKLFEREAQTLQNLDSPAIPRYLDYFELNSPKVKGFALVQTYIEAKSLETQLQGGRTFSESELKQIAKAVLEILIYLHQHQPPVIHRDIKPSNILLTNRSGNRVGEVYLVDFGSVQTLAAQQGGTITVVGTYGYMPPEQFGGRAVPASDLYSLGATLIYLATGRHPADLPQQRLRIQFEQFANLEPAFTSWLKWMTQPSLDKRLASATEALQAIEAERMLEPIPIVPKKPAGSNVVLKKYSETLEITFLPQLKANDFLVTVDALLFAGLSYLLILLCGPIWTLIFVLKFTASEPLLQTGLAIIIIIPLLYPILETFLLIINIMAAKRLLLRDEKY
ncbi:MAG: protein kinase [Hormoscilla sp.]